jgi:predicted dehydrogenase
MERSSGEESMSAIRFGILGATGFAAKRPLPGLLKARSCAVRAIHGPPEHQTVLDELARAHHIPRIYTTVEGLLADSQINAVYVATPAYLHKQHVILAARAGKHVLVEKPMALTLGDCRQMIAACRRAKVKLQVGYMRRFHPCHAKIKRLLDAGRLGKIVEARIQTHLWYPPAVGAWRQDPALGGGGAMMDMGSHCLELLEFLFGPIRWVEAVTANVVFDYPVEDLAIATVGFASGAVGIIDTSFAIPHRQNVLEIYGTEATLLARRTAGPFTDPGLWLLDQRGVRPVPVKAQKDQYQAEFEHFARTILENRQPEVDGPSGLRNLRQLLAIYQSARQQRRVMLP